MNRGMNGNESHVAIFECKQTTAARDNARFRQGVGLGYGGERGCGCVRLGVSVKA